METIDLDALARAIVRDCGMTATVRKYWGPKGLSRAAIQVALIDQAQGLCTDHWKHFEAKGESELPALRDAVTQFIIDNRRDAA